MGVPLLSQTNHKSLDAETRDALIHRIQFGGDEVVQAKDGAGSATLSMAYAAQIFTDKVLEGLNGKEGIIENAYVESELLPQTPYFASPCRLGTEGVEEVLEYGALSAFE